MLKSVRAFLRSNRHLVTGLHPLHHPREEAYVKSKVEITYQSIIEKSTQ